MAFVPNLRFPGFEEEWKVERLGEVGDIITGSTPPTNDETYYNGDYLFVSPADINGNRFILDSKTNLTKKGFNKGRIVRSGSSMFVCIGSTIGKIGQIEKDCVSNQQINSVVPFNKSNDNFVFSLLEFNSKKIKELSAVQAVPIINKTTFSNYKLKIPELNEQTKIADFIVRLDQRIQTQNEIIEEYETLKRALVQEVFSKKKYFKNKNGEEFPKWKNVELKDVLEYKQPTKYIVKSTEYDNSYDTPVLTAGKTFILGYSSEKENIFTNVPVIIFDDFTMAQQFVDFPFKVKSSAMKILENNPKISNIKFIFEAMKMINYPKGDEHKRFWISEYSKIKIKMPSLEEQNRIADFLSKIDDKIQVEKQSLESLNSQKKYFLQQLFI